LNVYKGSSNLSDSEKEIADFNEDEYREISKTKGRKPRFRGTTLPVKIAEIDENNLSSIL
jgi:hypothetical protein